MADCGRVKIDDAYWGGKFHEGKRGRGSENKTFIASILTDEHRNPQYMKFSVVPNFRRLTIQKWTENSIALGATVVSDCLSCFQGIKEAGCHPIATVTGRGVQSVKKQHLNEETLAR